MRAHHVQKILKRGRGLFLVGDTALEEGTSPYSLKTIDPSHMLDIALEGNYTGLSLTPGVAEKYHHRFYKDVPLIINVTGHVYDAVVDRAVRLASVDRAVRLGASVIGFHLYDGRQPSTTEIASFSEVVEKAHEYGVAVLAYVDMPNPNTEVLANASRTELELGADLIRVPYNNDPKGFEWVVKCAGIAKILIADLPLSNEELLVKVHEAIQAGAAGIMVNKTIWQQEKPINISRALRKVVLEHKSPKDAHI